MALMRHAMRPALYVLCVAVILLGTVDRATSYSQGQIFQNIITDIIRRQQELEQRRREEVAATQRLQSALSELGFYSGPIDGEFGPRTAKALAAYRRSVGRPASGALAYEEIAEIESQASQKITPEPEPPSSPDEQITTQSESFIRADTPPRLDAKLSEAAAWLVIASRETPEEAKEVAEPYLQWFPSTIVTRSSNGLFAVSIGWLNREHGRPLKDDLIAKKLIPSDSFLSSGEKFDPPLWSRDGHSIKTRPDLLKYALLRATPALRELSSIGKFNDIVSGLSAPTEGLSLRTGASASSKEIRQLPEGTPLQVVRSKQQWHHVKLLNGMSGWVSAEYVSRSSEASAPPKDGEEISPERQEHQRQVIERAHALLDAVVVFLKRHPDLPDIASVAQEVSKLQLALGDEDVPQVEASTQSLKSLMDKVPEFKEDEEARAKELKKAQIRARGDAVRLASKHVMFLRGQIAGHVTSPSTPALATLLREYEGALRHPDLPTLTDLNDRLKKLVSEQRLTDAYEQAMRELEARPREPIPESESNQGKSGGAEITDRNRFLMSGELTDWVLLFNSKNGPHVARNIRGDITFDGHEASVCFLHPPAEKMAGAEIAEVLEGYGVEHVDLDPGQCSEINLTSHDVLIANRGEFLKQTGRYMAPLLGLIEEGTFQQLKTLPDSEIAELSRRWAAKAEEIEREVKAGIRQGYGLVKVENESTLICMTPGTQEDVLRSLISDQRKVLARFFAKPPEISIRTAEAAFSASKRGECGAVFAGHADLLETIQALQRDTIGYAIIPLWFTEKEIADRAEEIQRTKNLLVEQEAARKQQIQEAKQLDELKKQKEAEQKGSRESELRKQHEPKARALADKIANAIKLLVDDKKTWAANNFTALANWYRERDAEGWTFVDLKYPIEDYGVADWKGRPLEVVFTDVSISMKHRLLGETRPFCFRLGIIFDAEYEMHRDPFERPCEDASDASKDWKQARKFESLWVVE